MLSGAGQRDEAQRAALLLEGSAEDEGTAAMSTQKAQTQLIIVSLLNTETCALQS